MFYGSTDGTGECEDEECYDLAEVGKPYCDERELSNRYSDSDCRRVQ